MSRISISETQFAFAFFHKYLSLAREDDVLFCFPTLRQEGNPKFDYAGADLVVNQNLFFQFKMPDFLRTRNAKEIREELLDIDFVPFYRFFIKNSDPSNQFNLLKRAAGNPSNIVRYISPMFLNIQNQQTDEEAFFNYWRMIPEASMDFICSIGFEQFVGKPEFDLERDNSHKICYSPDNNQDIDAYLFSKPKKIKAQKGLYEYYDKKLVFDDNPQNFKTIEVTLKETKEVFFDGDDEQGSFSNIEQLQMELLVKHNIFWIPVLRSKEKRRLRLITSLVEGM